MSQSYLIGSGQDEPPPALVERLVPQRVLERETVIERPLDEVFEFFSRAENLEKITPPTLSFKILTPLPIEMRQGAQIDYRIQLMGIPMKWKTEIEAWEPPYRFVDNQLKGPYLRWWHEHRFVAEGDHTRMYDRVEYRVPGGPFEPLVHKLFVGPQVKSIFDHRTEIIRTIFATV